MVYNLLNLRIGNLALADIRKDRWGNVLTLECIYTYPPEEKRFNLVFKDCRSVQWYTLKSAREMPEHAPVQVITHDLGEAGHKRTARITTVVNEIIISYGELVVEKDW